VLLADRRIELDPRPAATLRPVLDVVMLGHCPGVARWDRLGRDALTLGEIEALGLHAQVRSLSQLATNPGPGPTAGDTGLKALYGVPLPIQSLGQFQALFPEAFARPAAYCSALAGDRAWLPLAVQDFFDHDDPLPFGALRLWVIRVDEALGVGGFLPDPEADLIDPDHIGPFERALSIPRAGILALPDLERVLVPANLADLPPVRLPNPQLSFLPCRGEIDAGHQADPDPAEPPDLPATPPPEAVLPALLRALRRFRPDLHCLLSLPLDPEARGELPQPDRAFLAAVAGLAGLDPATGLVAPRPSDAPRLHQIQFLYPYLRGADRRLASATGVVAGVQANLSHRLGPWRSAAGRRLPGRARPYPPVGQQEATRLRESPGVGVLVQRQGAWELDDERLAGPVFPPPAHLTRPGAPREDTDYRSGELARFMGWLRRELTDLGEQVLFDLDPADPRLELLLRRFFTRLYERGALRGALPEQAFNLTRVQAPEGVVAFDIALAPAFPIDRIRISFAQDRNAGAIGLEVDGA
jgi:hypothetical protein